MRLDSPEFCDTNEQIQVFLLALMRARKNSINNVIFFLFILDDGNV